MLILSKQTPVSYLKGLNGIRFLLAMLVLLGHTQSSLAAHGVLFFSEQPILHKQSLSVEFFFILSGFLLTFLAVGELEKTGTLHIRNFFIRRILRIMPLYYWFVALNFALFGVIIPLTTGKYHLQYTLSEGLFFHLLFLPNFIIAKYPNSWGPLYALWSIGVEEQFYLFFPFLMPFLLRRKRVLFIFIMITALYFVVYFYIENAVFPKDFAILKVFLHTLKFQFMFLGAAAAVLFAQYKAVIQKLMQYEMAHLIIWLLFLHVLFVIPENYGAHLWHSLVFCALLLSIAAHQSRFFRLEWQPLAYLGSLSYGIYVYHSLVLHVFTTLLYKKPLLTIYIKNQPLLYYFATICVSIVVAHFSFRYFEMWFLRLKTKFL